MWGVRYKLWTYQGIPWCQAVLCKVCRRKIQGEGPRQLQHSWAPVPSRWPSRPYPEPRLQTNPPGSPSAWKQHMSSFRINKTRPAKPTAPVFPSLPSGQWKPKLVPRFYSVCCKQAQSWLPRWPLKPQVTPFNPAPAFLHLPFFSPVSKNEADRRRTQWTRGAESSSLDWPMSPLIRQGWNRKTDSLSYNHGTHPLIR